MCHKYLKLYTSVAWLLRLKYTLVAFLQRSSDHARQFWCQSINQCRFAVNWEAIKVEISCSNVIQRDNLTFARALDRGLMDIAKENDDTVSALEK